MEYSGLYSFLVMTALFLNAAASYHERVEYHLSLAQEKSKFQVWFPLNVYYFSSLKVNSLAKIICEFPVCR